jgi:hypothetical protein
MSYNLLRPVKIITAGDMSAASITSSAAEIKLQDNIGIQLSWTGSPVGTFAVQISADHNEDSMGNVITAGNWISLPLNPAIVASGSADNAYIDLNQQSAQYIRVVYTKTSGTGTLNAIVVGKGV